MPDTHDPLVRVLTGLTRITPDQDRSAAVRQRCHAALVARQRRQEEAPVRHRPGVALVGLLCAVYLAEIAWQAVTMFFVRPT